ncbi:DUF305 domain-containing protein [Microbacterium sp. T32]|nr:DUF305 domain-containing protein [Microbacterium sp. T32]KZE41722.1 DUF305 domain-containing protein [Microbacterium sp. T32]
MNIRAAATAALTLTSLLVLAGCPGATTSGSSMPGMDHGSSSATPAQSADANEADVIFATMMIEHHTQAIEMSDILLAKIGIDERVTVLVEQIKAAHQPEIAQMKGWLEDWGASTPDTGSMEHGGGMMSEGDMQSLKQATGTDAARLFLQQTIQHHRGAIEMAQEETGSGKNSDAVALANQIVESQTSETAAMEELLAAL